MCLMACLQNTSKREPDHVQRRSEALLEGFLEKALATVFPSEQQFPFTAKLSAEMLAIDGGSAIAALEGASLALKDAGVPSRSSHASDLVAGVRLRGFGVLLGGCRGAIDLLHEAKHGSKPTAAAVCVR